MSDRFTKSLEAAAPAPRTGWLAGLNPMVRNVAMFVATMAATIAVAQGAKSIWAGPQEYVLTARRDIGPGESVTPLNAEWRVNHARATGVQLTKTTDKSAPITGLVAVEKIGVGKPIPSSALAARAGDQHSGDIGLAGFILGSEELGEAASYLKAGDRVDLIGLINPSDKHGDFTNATVATVVRGAEVKSVTHPISQGRLKAIGSSAVVGVTEEQARLLGLLRRFGSLEVTLSPKRLNGWEDSAPDLDWQGLERLGINAPAAAAPAAAPTPAPEPQSARASAPAAPTTIPIPPSELVETLSPGSSQQVRVKS